MRTIHAPWVTHPWAPGRKSALWAKEMLFLRKSVDFLLQYAANGPNKAIGTDAFPNKNLKMCEKCMTMEGR